jgi:hypothetical protein
MGRTISSAILACALVSSTGCATLFGGGEDAVVSFEFTRLNPKTVRIPTTGTVSWVNLGEESVGFVILPTDMLKSSACTDLSQYFHETEAGYQSRPITGTESERVELPCALAPGSYPYEVWVAGAGFGESWTIQQKLKGTIVVE